MSDITKEQIDAVLKGENKELIGQVVAAAMQTEVGKTILNNHLSTGSTSIKDAAFKEGQTAAYGNIDTALSSFGIDIPTTINKASEKVAHVVKSLQSQIEEIKKEGGASKADKEQIAALTDKLATFDELFKTKEEEYNAKINDLSFKAKKGEFDSISLNYDPSQSKFLIDNYRSTLTKQLVEDSKIVDGKTVYYDEDGKQLLNEERGYATPKEILESKMSDALAKSNGGGGADKDTSVATSLEGDTLTLSKPSYASSVELYAAIREALGRKGITPQTEGDRYNKIFAATKLKYKDNELPEY